MIHVNAHALRFVREDVLSVDAPEQALRFQPMMRHWVVFDQSVMEQAPPLIEGWTTQDMLDVFEEPPVSAAARPVTTRSSS